MEQLKRLKKNSNRLDKYNKKNVTRKKKLRQNLETTENVLVLAERIKKNLPPVSSKNKQFKIVIIVTKKMHL